jgi:antitoxin component of RelBE/YafQ-DinJ toxin-antitoxin module
MSSAISIYLKQIALHKAIPFKLSSEVAPEPTDELKTLLANVRDDIKNDRNLSPAMNGDEAIAYLKGLRE